MKKPIPDNLGFYKEETKANHGLAVLCVNCERYIIEDDADSHSSVCYRTSKVVKESQNRPWLEESQFKLERFKECIEMLRKRISAPGERSYLVIISRVCGKVAGISRSHEITELAKYQKSIEDIMEKYNGSTSLQLAIERLKALLEDHRAALSAGETEHDAIKDLRAKVSFYQRRLRRLEKNFCQVSLETVESDVSSVKSPRLTNRFTFNKSADVLSPKPAREIYALDLLPYEESQKRKFYAVCLALKLNFPQNHPAYKVPVKKLYRLSIEQDVTSEHWKSFILNYLQNLPKSLPTKRKSSLNTDLFKTIIKTDEMDKSEVSY